MAAQHGDVKRSVQSMRGITLTELLVVVAMISILGIIVTPHVHEWRNNIVYRHAARSISLVLRETRSKAIATNHEHRVELDPSGKMYRITQGNRSAGSTEWSIVVQNWTTLPREVLLKTNVNSIQMNTNGTANGGTINILDLSEKPKFAVVINRVGRIRTT